MFDKNKKEALYANSNQRPLPLDAEEGKQLSSPIEKPSKQKKSSLAVTCAFLAGALTYAIFAAGYNLYLQSITQNNADTKEVTSSVQKIENNTEPELPKATQQVTSEELNKYVVAVDCTTKSEYSSLETIIKNGDLGGLNLYDGARINVAFGVQSSRTYSLTWTTLPTLLDYKCNKIPYTDITDDDRLNVYVDKGTQVKAPSAIENARVLQKSNK